MDNVVSLFPLKKEEVPNDPTYEFIYNHLIPWAEDHGLDTSSRKFKLNAASIMTCLQGLLAND